MKIIIAGVAETLIVTDKGLKKSLKYRKEI